MASDQPFQQANAAQMAARKLAKPKFKRSQANGPGTPGPFGASTPSFGGSFGATAPNNGFNFAAQVQAPTNGSNFFGQPSNGASQPSSGFQFGASNNTSFGNSTAPPSQPQNGLFGQNNTSFGSTNTSFGNNNGAGFGSQQNEQPKTNGFSFGAENTNTSSFNFGASTNIQPPSSSSFNFATTAPINNPFAQSQAQQPAQPIQTPSFSFGASSQASSNPFASTQSAANPFANLNQSQETAKPAAVSNLFGFGGTSSQPASQPASTTPSRSASPAVFNFGSSAATSAAPAKPASASFTFGQQAATTAAEPAKAASFGGGLFGQSAPSGTATPNLFGAASGSSTPKPNQFGQATTPAASNIFGQPKPAEAKPNPFGQLAQSSADSNKSEQQQPLQTPASTNVFTNASSPSASSLFSKPGTSSTPAASNLFGFSNAAPAAPAAETPKQEPPKSLFGAVNSSTPSALFGAKPQEHTPKPATSNLFGANAQDSTPKPASSDSDKATTSATAASSSATSNIFKSILGGDQKTDVAKSAVSQPPTTASNSATTNMFAAKPQGTQALFGSQTPNPAPTSLFGTNNANPLTPSSKPLDITSLAKTAPPAKKTNNIFGELTAQKNYDSTAASQSGSDRKLATAGHVDQQTAALSTEEKKQKILQIIQGLKPSERFTQEMIHHLAPLCAEKMSQEFANISEDVVISFIIHARLRVLKIWMNKEKAKPEIRDSELELRKIQDTMATYEQDVIEWGGQTIRTVLKRKNIPEEDFVQSHVEHRLKRRKPNPLGPDSGNLFVTEALAQSSKTGMVELDAWGRKTLPGPFPDQSLAAAPQTSETRTTSTPAPAKPSFPAPTSGIPVTTTPSSLTPAAVKPSFLAPLSSAPASATPVKGKRKAEKQITKDTVEKDMAEDDNSDAQPAIATPIGQRKIATNKRLGNKQSTTSSIFAKIVGDKGTPNASLSATPAATPAPAKTLGAPANPFQLKSDAGSATPKVNPFQPKTAGAVDFAADFKKKAEKAEEEKMLKKMDEDYDSDDGISKEEWIANYKKEQAEKAEKLKVSSATTPKFGSFPPSVAPGTPTTSGFQVKAAGPADFAAEFKKQAEKAAEEAMLKKMDEDYDSDDGISKEEWIANYKKEQAEKAEKLKAQSVAVPKFGGFTPKPTAAATTANGNIFGGKAATPAIKDTKLAPPSIDTPDRSATGSPASVLDDHVPGKALPAAGNIFGYLFQKPAASQARGDDDEESGDKEKNGDRNVPSNTPKPTGSLFDRISKPPGGASPAPTNQTWSINSPIKFAASPAVSPAATPAATSGSGLFGNLNASTAASPAASGIFGSLNANAAPSPSGGLFGSVKAPAATGNFFGGVKPTAAANSDAAKSANFASGASTPATSDANSPAGGDDETETGNDPQADLGSVEEVGEETLFAQAECKLRQVIVKDGKSAYGDQMGGVFKVLKNNEKGNVHYRLRLPNGRVGFTKAFFPVSASMIGKSSVKFMAPPAEAKGSPEQWIVTLDSKPTAEKLTKVLEDAKKS
jgi:hypothetical protein